MACVTEFPQASPAGSMKVYPYSDRTKAMAVGCCNPPPTGLRVDNTLRGTALEQHQHFRSNESAGTRVLLTRAARAGVQQPVTCG